MPAAKKNLKIEQYVDFSFGFKLVDPITGTGIDVSSYDFFAQIKSSHQDVDPLVSFTKNIQDQTTNAGEVRMTLSRSDIASLPLNSTQSFVWDLVVKRPDGTYFRLFEGAVNIDLGVTNAG